jgi:hypothetical protein
MVKYENGITYQTTGKLNCKVSDVKPDGSFRGLGTNKCGQYRFHLNFDPNGFCLNHPEYNLTYKVVEESENYFFKTMFEDVPATKKFVGISTGLFSIKPINKLSVYIGINDNFYFKDIKDLILALEATLTHLENKP